MVPTSAGTPILDDAHASVECRAAEIVERGDQHVVIGEVITYRSRGENRPSRTSKAGAAD